MRFKLNLKAKDLDWNNPDILNYQYIFYLKNMIEERFKKANISYTSIWNSSIFAPNGILTFSQIQMIYNAMIHLGINFYLNEEKFNETYWKNGDCRIIWNYSLSDMCNIANFDFFANPLIPGLPIKYYEKFLKPIHDVLSAFKKVWLNNFIVTDIEYYSSSTPPLPTTTVTINGETKTVEVNGSARENFWKDEKNIIQSAMDEGIKNIGRWNGTLGYLFSFTYVKWDWFGYDGKGEAKRYECVKWCNFKLVKQFRCRSLALLHPGTNYTLYLVQAEARNCLTYHSGYNPNGNVIYTQLHNQLHYNRPPYGPIRQIESGTITNEDIKGIFTVSLGDELLYNVDLTDIPVSDFVEEQISSSSTKTYNIDKWYCLLGCSYSPLLVIDLTPVLEYL